MRMPYIYDRLQRVSAIGGMPYVYSQQSVRVYLLAVLWLVRSQTFEPSVSFIDTIRIRSSINDFPYEHICTASHVITRSRRISRDVNGRLVINWLDSKTKMTGVSLSLFLSLCKAISHNMTSRRRTVHTREEEGTDSYDIQRALYQSNMWYFNRYSLFSHAPVCGKCSIGSNALKQARQLPIAECRRIIRKPVYAISRDFSRRVRRVSGPMRAFSAVDFNRK